MSEISNIQIESLNLGLKDNIARDNILNINTEIQKIEDIIEDTSVSVKRYGVVGDGIADDLQGIQDTIDYVSSKGGGVVYLPKGKYYCSGAIILKSNVTFRGEGEQTVIDFKDNAYGRITTQTPTLNPLVLTSNLLKGEKSVNISNTTKTGDFIRFKSSSRFTEKWDDGNVIRPYYLDGELFRVNSSTTSHILLDTRSRFNFTTSNITDVDYFTPNRNIVVENIKIVREQSITGETCAILIGSTENFKVNNVYTENNNYGGVVVDRSMYGNISNINTLGGTDNLGLNYGISINDGSKDINVSNLSGNGHRHVIAMGGSGYAIPMYNVASNIYAVNSSSHSIDTHGCVMDITFDNCNVDNGVSVSGIGITVKNLNSLTGPMNIYEGGINIRFEGIRYENCSEIYANHNVYYSTFKDVDIKTRNLRVNDIRSRTGINYDNYRIVNTLIKSATSV